MSPRETPPHAPETLAAAGAELATASVGLADACPALSLATRMERPVHTSEKRAPAPPLTLAPLFMGQGLEAVVIDDVAFDRRRIIRTCDRAGLRLSFTEVATIGALERELASRRFDLAFVDYRLTDGDGLAVVNRLAEGPGGFAGAVIMLAGESDARVAVRAMKAGCTDYIAKSDLTPDSIRRAVLGGLERAALRRDLDRVLQAHGALIRSLERLARSGSGAVQTALGRLAQGPAGAATGADLRVIAAHVDALIDLARRAAL